MIISHENQIFFDNYIRNKQFCRNSCTRFTVKSYITYWFIEANCFSSFMASTQLSLATASMRHQQFFHAASSAVSLQLAHLQLTRWY